MGSLRRELLGGLYPMCLRQALVPKVDVEGQARNDEGLKGHSEGSQDVVDDSKKGEGHSNEPDQ